MVQDEIQSYHWCKKQCSIHPIVIYCMKEKLEGSSFLCDWNRDVGFISQVIHQTVDHIKTHLFSSITKIYYFFDSCAWQYKNCKPFYNLCHPAEDFSISCIWKFFATSHGKSPCDSIVGTEKACGNCQFAEPGFQSYPFSWSNVQILSAFNAIKFVYITVEEMEQTRNKFADRLSVAATVPRTRSFHQIVPLSKSMVSMKRIYHDDDFALEFDILKSKKNMNVCRLKMWRSHRFYYVNMMNFVGLVWCLKSIFWIMILRLSLCIQLFPADFIAGQIGTILIFAFWTTIPHF